MVARIKIAVSARSRLSVSRPIPRRGLSRTEAAMYIGVSLNKFDELVATKRMPSPRRIDSRKVWDVWELDEAFVALPKDDDWAGNSWEDV
jgi:hypothetical protein